MREKTYKRVDAVRKAGEILKYLANQKEPCSSTEVVNALGLPNGTAMCYLVTLEDLGFVQGVGGGWRLGLGLGLIYAKVRSALESEREKISQTLKEMEASNGE